MKPTKKTFRFGRHEVVLETGGMARQATGAVKLDMEGTVVLATVVAKRDGKGGRSFLPLTVNYQERTYAAGRIPGGFFRREGRPTEAETLISRLIDRPLRPLFPDRFTDEVQVVATVVSLNPEVEPDVVALLASAAAVAVAGLPLAGTLAAARVGYRDGAFLLNPSRSELGDSKLDLVVAGTESAVVMVESEAKELPEQVMLDAVQFGHREMQVAIAAIRELAAEAGAGAWDWQPPEPDAELEKAVAGAAGTPLRELYRLPEKANRQQALRQLRDGLMLRLAAEQGHEPAAIDGALHQLEKHIVRGRILTGDARIDGRDSNTVRPITIRPGVLPRTHGSVLFTRGETQALVVATLGGPRDAQAIDALGGERREPFMLHYNFPPYCVGETGMMIGPKRREIGHGRLARRALEAVMPSAAEFPYTVRVVSEITESNGSSSMATVCGASLALMDAGVPLKAPVAGIAMGLIKDGGRYAILTDILGDEDHLGDMDFKVAGTERGVTALQMDIKTDGLSREIMQHALEQAREARLHILGRMHEALARPREQLSPYAPRLLTVRIDRERIKDLIGKGGSTIRALMEKTGTRIDVDDDGLVTIAATDGESGAEARRLVELITAEVEVGRVYDGQVVKLLDFGAFVAFLPGKEGLVHISQISEERTERVTDKLAEGQAVKVKVLEIDRQGRVRLSMRAVA
jgi:polyribonucleotide nucleotidyltransferase